MKILQKQKLPLFFICTLLYLEAVYHFAAFGSLGANPMMLLPLALLFGGLQALLCSLFHVKVNKIIAWCILILDFLLYFIQLVYISIFDQALLIDAVIHAGQAALTDFGQEAFHGVLACMGYGLLMAVPFVALGIFIKKKILTFDKSEKIQWIQYGISSAIGLLFMMGLLFTGYQLKWDSYDEYQGFYDPSTVIGKYGVLPAVQRDLLDDTLPASSSTLDALLLEADEVGTSQGKQQEGGSGEDEFKRGDTQESGTQSNGVQGSEVQSGTRSDDAAIDTSPNVLDIDFTKLQENADNDLVKQLAAYMEISEPTNKNEYTGMFEGYNLIYMTAEGFSPYAIDETLTPTLYKLTHSGFVAEDYYVPLWQTSTSDGEYVNLTGLVPDQQFSMRRSAVNEQPFSLPAYFAAEGVKSYAYHNNSLSYYDRYKSHPNLGYDFKAARSGSLSEEEWGSQLFAMENEDLWPASDLDMLKATLPEYINDDRFHAYYMTISGHMEYNFEGNDMSKLHQEEVANLPYSDAGRAYIACNIELDRALEYLIEELDKAGKLEKTVIAISSDHYPYGLEISAYEELAGMELDGTLDLYRNSLILWNSEMETVKIDKTCSALDLLPTIYNLFGFEYDSRLYAGKDMLSDSENIVVFANQSFITDTMSFNSTTNKVTMLDGSDVNQEEFEKNQQKVKGLFEYSAGIINSDFYRYINDARIDALADVPAGE